MFTKSLPLALLLASVWAATSTAGQAPVYTLLYSPPLTTPGGNPTTMFEVSPGVFCVLTAREGGSWGATIVTVASNATYKVIYSLAPSTIANVLVQGTNGVVYGPGFLSGSTVAANYYFYFSLSPSGQNEKQYSLPGTWGSAWETIVVPQDQLHDIVAMATQTVPVYGFARITEAGKTTILHQFSTAEGYPVGTNIVYGPDGNIYGVGNQQHGDWQNQGGFIYRFTQGGAYSQLLTFPTFPATGRTVPLIAGSDGNLYGLFHGGGANNRGQIYQATLAGQLTALASFPATGMSAPETLMQATDGNIYGSTDYNTIFRYNLATKQLSSAYQLASNGSQGACPCQLVEGMDGKLYGVTPIGGAYPGIGCVFSIDFGLPKPLPVVSGLYPSSGPVSQTVTLWGNYLLGATSVAFNGVLATDVLVTSVHSVRVTVPAEATTGPVSVTTANGSFTTTKSFTVQ